MTTGRVVLTCEDCAWRWEGEAQREGLDWTFEAPAHEHWNFTARIAYDAEIRTTEPGINIKLTL